MTPLPEATRTLPGVTCKRCGAAVILAVTAGPKRRTITMNREPSPAGSFRLETVTDGALPVAVPVGAGSGTHVAHRATCLGNTPAAEDDR